VGHNPAHFPALITVFTLSGFPMSDANIDQPSFNIQRIYLKDLSVELPNAPQILLEQGNPNVDVQLNVNAENEIGRAHV
jgi:preprotein translocase subunit SecB